jgi:hypothetical protein
MFNSAVLSLYEALREGAIQQVIATQFSPDSRSLMADLADMGANVDGFVAWLQERGFPPYQLEVIGEDDEPEFQHDHPVLAQHQGKWLLCFQERGRVRHLRTYESRSEALHGIGVEIWDLFVQALKARDRGA